MKIMSYNIRLGIQEGVEAIARVIRAQNPDIVALQEVGKFWRMGPPGDTLAQLAEGCGFAHRWYLPTISQTPDKRYGHGILSRWPIQAPEIFEFSQQIDEPRAALIAQIQRPAGRLQLISTHLSHLDEERARHGDELVGLIDSMKEDGAPLILVGDLNDDEQASWMKTLLQTMQSAAEFTRAPTFPNPTPKRRIDHILVRGAALSAAQVLDEPDASDHRPLIAQLSAD